MRLNVGLGLALAAASVGGLAIAAHEQPLPSRRKPLRRTTEERLDAMRLEQEQARQRGNALKEAAERKRYKKAQQRAALAAKGAIQIVEAAAKPEPVQAETKAQRDARIKREKRAAAKLARAD